MKPQDQKHQKLKLQTTASLSLVLPVLCCSAVVAWMEEECDDRPYPQEVVLSQTCWEYNALLQQQNRATRQQEDVAVEVDSAALPSSKILSTIDDHHHHHGQDPEGDARRPPGRPPKRHKPSAPVSMRQQSAITSLQTLRLSGSLQQGELLRDLFVLVLQTSGLQKITSRAGFDVDFGTLLVADPSSAFLRVTLWRSAARIGARLIRAGDLVRLNRVGVSTFRGTVQAHSTARTRFRVVWRGDTFTTRDDAKATTMFSPSQGSNSRGRGVGGARFRSDPALSQDDDDLAVPREDACHLASWAKSEFPSVVSTDSRWRHQTGAGAGGGVGAGAVMVGSLGAVRKGVETTVLACVLNVSDVERLWVWDSVAGKRRKDLISRANALITDGMHREMTVQLWGDLACDETIGRLRAGAVAAQPVHASPGARKGPIHNPTVFEFTELQPEFSFSCEALVLNGKSGNIRTLPPESPEARRVSEAVVAAAAASLKTGQSRDKAVRAGSTVAAVNSAETSSRAEADFHARGVAVLPQKFESVAALMSADGFSGACHLSRVVVRKVDAPHLSSPRLRSPASSRDGGMAVAIDGRRPPGLGVVSICVGDEEESESANGVDRAEGVEAVIRVNVDGGALNDLLGCNPEDLLALAPAVDVDVDVAGVGVEVEGSGDGGGVGVAVEVARVLWSLLSGLEVGGERGERVDVVLACSACVDGNGWVTPGGSCYRLVSLHPSRDSSDR